MSSGSDPPSNDGDGDETNQLLPISAQLPEPHQDDEYAHSTFEADTCCGCCDLQTGAKIIAILGIVQGLTSCMSIGTAGFLSMPTLVIGILSIGFGLYGFWGAQKWDKHKIRVHVYWLLCVVVLYAGMGTARLVTAHTFCVDHNCVLEVPHPSVKQPQAGNKASTATLPPGKYVQGLQSSNSLVQEAASFKTTVDLRTAAREAFKADTAKVAPKPKPHYLDPCYLSDGKPSTDSCVKAHQLSAIATMAIGLPLNIYFAFIIHSFYKKVSRPADHPDYLGPPAMPVPARPVNVVTHQIPPMTVYNAAGLNGEPVTRRYLHDSPSLGPQSGDDQCGRAQQPNPQEEN